MKPFKSLFQRAPGALIRGAVGTLLLAARGAGQEQERSSDRQQAAALEARILEAPTSFDRTLLDQLAALGTRDAWESFRSLGAVLTDEERRLAWCRALPRFDDTDLVPEILETLTQQVPTLNGPVLEHATEAVAAFGEPGHTALLAISEAARGADVRYLALHHFVRGAQVADRERVLAIAHGAEYPTLRRLGMPTDDRRWMARLSRLRCDSIQALAGMPDTETVLEPLLGDADPKVLGSALQILGRRGSEHARKRAREIMTENGPDTLKLRAVEVLRQEGSKDAVETLIGLTHQSAGEVRRFALRTLSVMNAHHVLAAVLPLFHARAHAADALLGLELLEETPGAVIDQAIQNVLDHEDALVRAAAVRALGTRGVQSTASTLQSLARKEKDTEVRAEAILAATRLLPTDQAWRKELRDLTRQRDVTLRVAAIDSLAWLQDRKSIDRLHQLLEDKDWRVRLAVVDALGRVRARDSVPQLLPLLKGDRARVRDGTVRALRRITAMPFRDWLPDWERWWADVKATFVVPPLTDVEQMEDRLSRSAARANTGAFFYGLRVRSDHLTVVVDVSGSMGGLADGTTGDSRLTVAKNEIDRLLEQLHQDVQFNLVFFNQTSHPWRRRISPLGPTTVARAMAFSRARQADGGTNLFGALETALDDPEVDTIYLLSDGQPTAGKVIEPSLIREQIRRQNPTGKVLIHCIAIGFDSALLRGLAEDSGGDYVHR